MTIMGISQMVMSMGYKEMQLAGAVWIHNNGSLLFMFDIIYVL